MIKTAGTKSDLDTDILFKSLVDLRDYGIKAINWTGGGEPTLHPKLTDMAVKVHSLGMKQGMFTNALSRDCRIRDARLLDWIRISLTEKYIDGIDKKLAAFYANNTVTGIACNVTPENEPMLDELCQQARDLGVHYFQVRPALQRRFDIQPDIKCPVRLKKYETDRFKVHLSLYKFDDCRRDKTYDVCRAGIFVPIIDFNGNVRRCNYHLNDESEAVGNIYAERFGAIMDRMATEVPVRADCQTCCKNHELNKLLDGLLGVEDVCFI